ncbi:MAG: epimerase [Chloroflexi bacterium RBG_16_48_8]|nr:MAG: epimerase [Chloroflexi bacterium RBG_16_48_8]
MVSEIHAVTGAFGYSGKYIATRLLLAGKEVITLTNSLHRENPFGESVRAFPFNYGQPDKLRNSLKGVEVLYNTYWIRFNYKAFGHTLAVENTRKLISAAKDSGVQRIVHISITNPSIDSPLEYFAGKAILEQEIIQSGISYAILRPTVLFGKEDILINNIAWTLRRFPIFGLFGDGKYRLQPIYVDDLAKLAVEHGQKGENVIVNAIGPETFTYREWVNKIGRIIGKSRPIIPMPARIAFLTGWIIGKFAKDVMITWPEVQGLMADLLHVYSPPTGHTQLTTWAEENAYSLGQHYASELMRRKVE